MRCVAAARSWATVCCLAIVVLGLLLTSASSVARAIRVGFYENPPKLFTDDSGHIAGFFPDVLGAVAEEEGWTIEYVPGTWAECLRRLEEGAIDLMPDVAYSEARAEIYGFAEEPLFINWGVIYQRPEAEIESIPDLVGKRIAVMEGSIHTEGEQGIKAILSQFDIECTYVELPDYVAVFEALQAGQAEAGAVNRLFALLHEDEYDIAPTTIVFNPRELRFAYPVDSTFGEQLAETIDARVRELKADPQSIYYRSLSTHLLREGRAGAYQAPRWLLWLAGWGGAVLVLAALVIAYLRRQRRRLKVQLAASEIQFETMFEEAAVGIALVDGVSGRFVRVNPLLCEILGYQGETELLSRAISDVAKPDDVENQRTAETAGTCAGSPCGTGVWRYVRKDGSSMWGHTSISSVRDAAGSEYGLVVVQDVTERREAVEAVRSSEERLRVLFESAPDAIFLLSLTGEIVDGNPASEELTGYERDALIGENLLKLNLIAKGYQSKAIASLGRNALGHATGPDEYIITRKDGLRLAIEIRGYPITIEGKRCVLCVGRDITQRRQAERGRRRYESIVNTSKDLMTMIDSGYRYLAVSDSFCDCHGKVRDEIVGRTVEEVWGDEPFCNSIKTQLDRCLRGETVEFKGWFDTPLSGRRYYESQYSPFRDAMENKTLAIVVSRDATERRIAAEELAEHRDHLEQLVAERTSALNVAMEAANAAMFRYDLLTDTIETDERWIEIAGIEEGNDGEHDTWRQFVHPDDLEETLTRVRDVADSGGDSVVQEYRIVRPNGEERHIEMRARLVRDESGATAFVGMNVDITERRRAEEALRENEAFLRTMMEHMPIDFFAVDRDLRYTMQSPTSRAAIGDVLGKRVEEVDVPEEMKARWIDEHRHVFRGETLREEHDIRTQDGSVRTYLTQISPVRVGEEIVASIGSSMDITERKRREEQVRQLSRAIEGSPVSVVITDLAGTIEYVNPRFSEVSGYDVEEVLGENLRILRAGNQPASFYKDLWATILAGTEWRGELCNRKKSGEIYWELASISPIRNESGEITHFVAVKEDITERKHAAWELEQAKRDAEAASQTKSDFLANMSHELRTPLNAVIGFSEVLSDGMFGDLNERQQQYVRNIEQSGRHLLALINDILDLSKVEAGKMNLEPGDVDLSRLIFESLIFVQERAHKHGIEIRTDLTDEAQAVVVTADERKVKQVMFNLLSNATKFTPDGGSIRVTADVTDGDVRVSVADTGIGIRPEDLLRVFEEFEQIDSSYARTQKGTGLGLALAERLIGMHGGRIWAESDGEGKGSTFTFTLPLRHGGDEEGSDRRDT
jgi:PAS domain S-box-containing protein